MFSRNAIKPVKAGKVTVSIPFALSPTLAKFNVSEKVIEQLGFAKDDPKILIDVIEDDSAKGLNSRFAIKRGSQCKVSPSIDNDKQPTGSFTFSQSRAWGVIIQYRELTPEQAAETKIEEMDSRELRLNGFVKNNSGTSKGFATVEVAKDEDDNEIFTDAEGNILSVDEAELADAKYPILVITDWKFEAYNKKKTAVKAATDTETKEDTDEIADELSTVDNEEEAGL